MKFRSDPDARYRALAATLSVCSMGLLLFAVHRMGGIQVSYDGNAYMSVADNLLAGQGFRFYDGDRLPPHWTPGYPLLLAAVSGMFSVSAYHAGMALSVLCHGITVGVSLLWLRTTVPCRTGLLVGIALVVLSAPLMATSLRVRADPVTTLLMVSALYWLYCRHREGEARWSAVLGITALVAAAVMTRWIGITAGITAAVVLGGIYWQAHRWSRPMLYLRALLPVAVPLTAVVCWITVMSGGEATGQELADRALRGVTEPAAPGGVFLRYIGFYLVGWFVPIAETYRDGHAIEYDLRSQVAGTAALLAVALFGAYAAVRGVWLGRFAVPSLFAVVYLTVLTVVAATVWNDAVESLSPRHTRVDPIYIPLVLALLSVSLGPAVFCRRFAARMVRGGACLLLVLLILTTVFGLRQTLVEGRDNGWTRYAQSDFGDAVRNIPEDAERMRSNRSYMLYYVRGRPAEVVRSWSGHDSPLDPGEVVVLFKLNCKNDCEWQKRQLTKSGALVAYEDEFGVIYRMPYPALPDAGQE